MPRAKPDELLTVAQLARRWRVSPQRIDQMVRDGLPLTDRSRPRRVSLMAAEAFRVGYNGADGRGGVRAGAGRRAPAGTARKRTRPADPAKPVQAPPAASEPTPSSAEPVRNSLAWERREEARLRREELEEKRAVRAGELVPVAVVRRALVEHAERCRRRMERTVTGLTHRILVELQMTNSAESHLERILSSEITAALADLADMPPLAAPSEALE